VRVAKDASLGETPEGGDKYIEKEGGGHFSQRFVGKYSPGGKLGIVKKREEI